MADRTFVIAEAAACHDGDIGKALRLIHLASGIGAEAVKFQYLSSPERLAERRRAPEYIEHYRLLSFPRTWFPILLDQCRHDGIEFMCTAYLPEDIAVVEPYVKRFKVSSFESRDAHFVGLHAEWDKPIIISAGMGGDIERSLAAYYRLKQDAYPTKSVAPFYDVSVLHCVSAYPTPYDQINLAALHRHHNQFSRPYDGLSDHTRHPWTGALAVGAGAKIVEFHMRLDDTLPENADYAVSRAPDEAAEYVRNIRTAEEMMGDGLQGVQPAEQPMTRYQVNSKEGR